jgi:hypothetical protein
LQGTGGAGAAFNFFAGDCLKKNSVETSTRSPALLVLSLFRGDSLPFVSLFLSEAVAVGDHALVVSVSFFGALALFSRFVVAAGASLDLEGTVPLPLKNMRISMGMVSMMGAALGGQTRK